MKVTRVFRENQRAKTPIVVNQGGSRSTKTYSIAQLLIIRACKVYRNFIISICRKTFPSLKSSVMRDFFEILGGLGLYKKSNHNKSDHTYLLNGNLFEFLSLDMPQKKRGAKRNILWMNEANEFTYEDYIQLAMRTSGQIFMDYNPSEEHHWIYDKIIPSPDCTFIKSTYLDNPALPRIIRRRIEALRENGDDNYWRIYGLGEIGKSTKTIYTNWDIVRDVPKNYDDFVWGLDFGYNNPSALVGIWVKDKEIWVREFIYETGLTNQALIERMEEVMPDEFKGKLVKADSSEPDRIQEIADAGFNILPVKKGKNSVKHGIDVLKRTKIHITGDSVNYKKEIKGYAWKVDKDGNIIDGEPVKFKDHLMDATRYGIGLDAEEFQVETIETIVAEDLEMGVEEVNIGDY